jgi:hypothetical protein
MARNRWLILAILAGALVFTSACGMVNTFLNATSSAGTVNEMWADVPEMDGMAKAELEMPLAAKLAIQAVTQGKISFIAYTTANSPQAVQEFYTQERMAAAGWNADDTPGCISDSSTESVGAVCFFGRQDGGQKEMLAIAVAKDDSTGETQVFFARIDASEGQSSQ